jgi:CubicO group peptidase (beta-lactamase class C family)
MNFIRCTLLALSGVLLIAQAGFAQNQGAATDARATLLTAPDLDNWLAGFMEGAMKSNELAGAVVVVVKDGRIFLQRGYGYADYSRKIPVDPAKTLFRPGSISKLFTWTAVMQLVEQGKIDLDADINEYLDFKIVGKNGKRITMRNLMTHRAGFEETTKNAILADPKKLVPLKSFVKGFIPERIYEPSGTPAYSNYGACLAGYIVERVSGEKFDDYIERHIFMPLDMQHSSFRQPLPAHLQGLMSKGYKLAGEPAQPYELLNDAPAGSLAASGVDIAKFMIAHLQNGGPLLKPETARMMHDFEISAFPALPPMALGFYRNDIRGQRIIAHGGDLTFFHSDLNLFTKDNIGIYISTNSAGSGLKDIRGALLSGFIHRYLPISSPDRKVAAATARQHAQQVAGTYVFSRRTDSNFGRLGNLFGELPLAANDDGSLSFSFKGQSNRYVEISPYLWRMDNGDELLNVTIKDGKPILAATSRFGAIIAMEPISFWQSSDFILPLVAISILILLVGVIAHPIGALVRRKYGLKINVSKYSMQGRYYRAGAASVALLAFALWLYVLNIGVQLGGFSDDHDSLILVAQIAGMVAFIAGLIAVLLSARECFSNGTTWLHRGNIIVWVGAMSVFMAFLFAYNLMQIGQTF